MEFSADIPGYERMLLPQLVDEIARSDPRRTFVSIPKSTNLGEGFIDIDYATFATAVNRFAWLVDEHLRGYRPIVALYMGPLDLRYLIVILGLCKSGHIALLDVDHENVEAHLSLLSQMQCRHVILPNGAPTVVEKILAARPMEILPLPDLDFFLNTGYTSNHYCPWPRNFDETKDDTFFIFGTPTPMYVTFANFASKDTYQLISSLGAKPIAVEYMKGKRIYVAFFHIEIVFTLGLSIYVGCICVFPPPGPLTIDLVNMALLNVNLDAGAITPIAWLYKEPNFSCYFLKHVSFVVYTSDSLPKDMRSALSANFKMTTSDLRSTIVAIYEHEAALCHPPKPVLNRFSKLTETINDPTNTSSAIPLSYKITSPTTMSDIDARIEAVLERTLPKFFARSLRPSLAGAISSPGSAHISLAESNQQDPLLNKFPELPPTPPQKLRLKIFEIISNTTYTRSLSASSNLFACGLTSLQIPNMVGQINRYLISEKQPMKIDDKFIYDNPTINDIVMALCNQPLGEH